LSWGSATIDDYYAQIGGLAMATVITLLLVPVFYSIAVLDLKIIKWAPGRHEPA
jgi:hypothetical protein